MFSFWQQWLGHKSIKVLTLLRTNTTFEKLFSLTTFCVFLNCVYWLIYTSTYVSTILKNIQCFRRKCYVNFTFTNSILDCFSTKNIMIIKYHKNIDGWANFGHVCVLFCWVCFRRPQILCVRIKLIFLASYFIRQTWVTQLLLIATSNPTKLNVMGCLYSVV